MKIFILLLIFQSPWSLAEDFSGKSSMNGILYEEFKDFPSKWEIVTIRFRKDTGEMRLTYAKVGDENLEGRINFDLKTNLESLNKRFGEGKIYKKFSQKRLLP